MSLKRDGASMYKLNLYLVCLLLSLISPYAMGQSFFNFGSTKPSSSATVTPSFSTPTSMPIVPGPIKILSPSQFKTQVETLSKQNQQQLTDQLNQQLAQKPPIKPETVSAPPPSSLETNAPASAAPSQNLQPTYTQPPSPPAQTGNYAPPQSSAPTYVAPRPVQPQAPVYSGWGNASTQQQAPTPTPPTPNSSGQGTPGWGIKY